MKRLRVLVTGSDWGLGLALVNLFAAQGAQVYGGLLGPCPWPESRARALALDVSSAESVAAAARQVGPLDLLINNAGILGDIENTAWDPLDFEEMGRVYQVNTLGSLRVTQAFLPHLLRGDQKLIVNVSSEAGSIGLCARESWYGYAMAKAALNMQSALLHNLLRPHGGKVLVVHPGHVRTFMRGHEDTSGTLSPEEAAAHVVANIHQWGQSASDKPEFRGPDGERLPW